MTSSRVPELVHAPQRYAIADPPYLGVAARFYGPGGEGYGRGHGSADEHPHAAEWDDPARHQQLVRDLHDAYDGWAVAASVSSRGAYEPVLPSDIIRATWERPNAPSAGRIRRTIEDVYAYIPADARGWSAGPAVSTVLRAGVNVKAGFIGAKPEAWTHWILDLLGYRPGVDQVDDLFPGSGAVSRAIATYRPTSRQKVLVDHRRSREAVQTDALAALANGASVRHVARQLNCSPTTVQKWKKESQ